MKKLLGLFCAVLFTITLTGCSSKADESKETQTETTQKEEKVKIKGNCEALECIKK